MKSFFITGTDTGIGKTMFTCGMAQLLHASGSDVGVMKPFATGAPQKNRFQSEDVSLLVKSSGAHDPENLINPYFFPIPVSPYLAARKLGKTIDVELVLSSFEKLQSTHDVMLVEGIGGIMTPILKDYFVADLIKDLSLDTIVVTGTKIGTINHTLLTLDQCKKFGIRVSGLVINNIVENGYDMQDLEADLVSLSGVNVRCKIPFIHDVRVEKISQFLEQNTLLQSFSKL
ncbi:MAG: dethiobiotin synthase [Thaumarchaeota archaeon]|nr:dethiobiotin synthase [Nitrososphaerota archaeon]